MTYEAKRAKDLDDREFGGRARARFGWGVLVLLGAACGCDSCKHRTTAAPTARLMSVTGAGRYGEAGRGGEGGEVGEAGRGGEGEEAGRGGEGGEGGGQSTDGTGCDPNCEKPDNGLGIYVAKGHNFCLKRSDGRTWLCPEAFTNSATGVFIKLREAANGQGEPGDGTLHEAQVSALLLRRNNQSNPTGSSDPETLELDSITGSRTKLIILYRRKGSERLEVALDSQLPSILLQFTFGVDSYRLKFEHKDRLWTENKPSQRLERYSAFYQLDQIDPPPDWTPLCDNGNKNRPLQTSFLEAWEVNDKWAKVTLQSHPANTKNAVTMSCQTGAIDTCVQWGYAPWATSENLFGACLQAKRAAYYVGKNDARSYTKSGTPISLQDLHQVHKDPIDHNSVEAVWGPGGAECLNVGKARYPELLNSSAHPSLGPCDPNDPSLSTLLPLATARGVSHFD